MEDIDMSRPSTELFAEPQTQNNYNSYADVNQGHVVDDPLNTGVNNPFDAADQIPQSDKELNFRALREEAAKLQSEREYWKGQAEAYAKMPSREQEQKTDAFAALDLSDSDHVRKGFETLREQNDSLRLELRDAITALQTRASHPDWNNVVTQHVPQLTSKNPIFAEMIQKASNPYEAAYALAQLNARATEAAQPPPVHGNAQRALSNAQKPQTLASVGGRGQLSQTDYYANMSDEDFMKVAARNMANI